MTYQLVDIGGQMVGPSDLSKMPIKEYYQNKVVFLTGGTGFLGQLFVEKLLRTGAKEIYVLTRNKKGKSSHERLSAIFSGTVFEKLAAIDPEYMKRIRVIDGNLLDLNVGISANDQQSIIENVQIVIHSAADVRFDEPLRHLILCNIRGTRELLALATRIRQLEVFLHISTAYSHCPRTQIDEEFYEAPIQPDHLITLLEHMGGDNEDIMDIITQRLTTPWPNTYTYTKAVAEELLRQYGKQIPVAILRPSIIIATHEDPIPGWINNVYGLTGVLVSVGLGFQRVLPYKDDMAGDIICADFVVNSVLAVGWITNCEKKELERNGRTSLPDTKIYNVTNYPEKTVTYGEIADEVYGAFHKEPALNNIWIPTGNTTESSIIELFYTIMYHVIPAFLSDLYFRIIGSEMRILPIYRKCTKFMASSAYFMRHQWSYNNDRMLSVYDRMQLADRKYFPCDVRLFNFRDYSPTYIRGMRKYIGHEDVETNQHLARAKYRKLRILHKLVLVIYYTFLAMMFYFLLKFFGFIGVMERTIPFKLRVDY